MHLDVTADRNKYLQSSGPQLGKFRNLVRQAYRLFGAHHSAHYTNACLKAVEARRKFANYAASIGFMVDKDGRLTDVQWNGPTFQAGLAPGMKLIAVGDRVYSRSALDDAITAAKGGTAPITLTVQNQGHVYPLQVRNHDGLRYPHLERMKGTPDTLDQILSPLR